MTAPPCTGSSAPRRCSEPTERAPALAAPRPQLQKPSACLPRPLPRVYLQPGFVVWGSDAGTATLTAPQAAAGTRCPGSSEARTPAYYSLHMLPRQLVDAAGWLGALTRDKRAWLLHIRVPGAPGLD